MKYWKNVVVRLGNDPQLEIGSDEHLLDGGSNDDDVIQHFTYIVGTISKEAMKHKTPVFLMLTPWNVRSSI